MKTNQNLNKQINFQKNEYLNILFLTRVVSIVVLDCSTLLKIYLMWYVECMTIIEVEVLVDYFIMLGKVLLGNSSELEIT